jgi:hypothetical protein
MEDLIATGKLHHVRRIHLEYHHHIGRVRDKLSLMLRWLEEAGFGYQVRAGSGPVEGAFQDMSLYCYRPATAPERMIQPG